MGLAKFVLFSSNDENLDDTIETISMDSNADEQIFEDNRDAQESKSHIKLRGQYEEGLSFMYFVSPCMIIVIATVHLSNDTFLY